MSSARLLFVLLQGGAAWRLPVACSLHARSCGWRLPVACSLHARSHGRTRPRMDTDWRPENLDPLGKVMGQAFGVSQFERTHELWLDLRTSENTFAQM